MKLILLLAVILVCGRCGLALYIQVSPDQFNAATSSRVSVSCFPDKPLDQDAQEIRMLEIARGSGKPIAVLTEGSEIIYGMANNIDYQVQGQISKTPSQSYLNLTLFDPTDEDMGSYKCSMYYLKKNGVLEKESAEGNMTMKNVGINSAIKHINGKFADVEKELQGHIMKVANHLETEILKQKEREAKLSNDIAKLQADLLSKKDYVSAFTARYTVEGSENKHDTIVFNDVRMNVGGSYDPIAGLYTAPRSGIYGFHLSGMMRNTAGWFELGMYVNDVVESTLSVGNNDYWDHSSFSVYVKLQAGDVVKVKVFALSNSRTGLRHDQFTTFSGHLIHELESSG